MGYEGIRRRGSLPLNNQTQSLSRNKEPIKNKRKPYETSYNMLLTARRGGTGNFHNKIVFLVLILLLQIKLAKEYRDSVKDALELNGPCNWGILQ